MLNQCNFIGNVGKDPEIRTMGSSGDKVANFSLAVTEKWKDRNSGERKEKTTWVPVVVFGNLVNTVENYVNKGDRLYISGAFTVRKWQDRDGNDRYSTECVLQGFGGKLVMLSSRSDNSGAGQSYGDMASPAPQDRPRESFDLDDSVPF